MVEFLKNFLEGLTAVIVVFCGLAALRALLTDEVKP